MIDAAFVINLDRDTERLAQFQSQSLPWEITRYPAYYGANLTPDQQVVKAQYVKRPTWISHSEIGCLLSHVTLWQKLADHKTWQRIAIFEDDARSHVEGKTIRRQVEGLYSYLAQNNILEPDMLYLGKSLDDCTRYQHVWGHVYRTYRPQCLHAYILTRAGANKLLQLAPYREAIDIIPIKALDKGLITAMTFHPSIYFQDIIGTTSNLRQLSSALNNTSECLVPQQYVSGDTWYYVIIIIVGLVAAALLCLWWVWYK